MEIANVTPEPNLAPIILWQYDKAKNLQRLIWHKEPVLTDGVEGGPAVIEQTGISQRISENAKAFYDDFHSYIFDAVNLAIREDVDAWDDNDIRKQKVEFGLSLWSVMIGIARPQYTETVGETSSVKNVRLKTWARYIKATFFKFRMNGSLYDINRYMNILMPELKIDVHDGGLDGDWIQNDKMTLTYSFKSEDGLMAVVGYRDADYNRFGATVSLSLVFTMTVDTTRNAFKEIFVAPYMIVRSENGVETRYIGTSKICINYFVSSIPVFGIEDLRSHFPVGAQKFVQYKKLSIDKSVTPIKIRFTKLNADNEEVDGWIPEGGATPDSVASPVKDQNGNVIGYDFTANANPLGGLPNWTSYIAEEYPEYAEMLKIPEMLPYPAGVADGSTSRQIEPVNGRYLGIVDANESKSTASVNWAKYTLDNSILYPDTSESSLGGNQGTANYLVTFAVDGGTAIQPQIVQAGGTANEPDDPVKTGYEFIGWYDSATGGNQFDFTKPIDVDTTIYAHYQEAE